MLDVLAYLGLIFLLWYSLRKAMQYKGEVANLKLEGFWQRNKIKMLEQALSAKHKHVKAYQDKFGHINHMEEPIRMYQEDDNET